MIASPRTNGRPPTGWLIAIVIGLAVACGGTTGGNGDGGSGPDGPTITVDAAPQTRPTVIFQTSGGGRTSSANFRAQLYLGAPQPMGRATSQNFKARLGPGSK